MAALPLQVPLMTTGPTLRDQGISDVIAADTAINRSYATYIRRAIRELVDEGKEFTADDVWPRAIRLCEDDGREFIPHDNNLIGGVTRGAAQAGLIVDTGRVLRSQRDAAHCRKLTIWRPAA